MSLRMQQKNRVLAVDPGYDRIGIAVMERDNLIHSECFVPLTKIFSERLSALFERITKTIKKHQPDGLAIETLFFSKNQKTAIHVAEARGVISVAASIQKVPVFEYSPQEVKIAVTGSGNAPKEQVIRMVERLVPLSKKKRLDDEYDAIALAIAHLAKSRFFHNP